MAVVAGFLCLAGAMAAQVMISLVDFTELTCTSVEKAVLAIPFGWMVLVGLVSYALDKARGPVAFAVTVSFLASPFVGYFAMRPIAQGCWDAKAERAKQWREVEAAELDMVQSEWIPKAHARVKTRMPNALYPGAKDGSAIQYGDDPTSAKLIQDTTDPLSKVAAYFRSHLPEDWAEVPGEDRVEFHSPGTGIDARAVWVESRNGGATITVASNWATVADLDLPNLRKLSGLPLSAEETERFRFQRTIDR